MIGSNSGQSPQTYQSRSLENTRRFHVLTHGGRVRHIWISKLTTVGSDNGLSPDRRQAITWTNAEILLIQTSTTNLIEIISDIHTFPFLKMHLKMPSATFYRPQCVKHVWTLKLAGRQASYFIDCSGVEGSQGDVSLWSPFANTVYLRLWHAWVNDCIPSYFYGCDWLLMHSLTPI